MHRKLLGIYLNDHLAGATTGQHVSRHIAEHLRHSPYGGELRRVAHEIAQDRQTLLELMDDLGVPERRHKVYTGRVAEKARLFKLNGRLVGRSALSTVTELEALRLGIEGKTLLWQTLLQFAPTKALDETRLKTLLERARHQAATVESARRSAAVAAFAPARRRGPARLLSSRA
ncbi:hypothetical protein FNH09_29280 [Streptomyces adustus]|uniref:Uncharacterized protein n=1 Tax=Streptomyces adustus TaxID=1609272 RepID=A0A5N8VJG4_9ACTN|nr:hypothetical protein [Streptomyces adustus]MPY35189.1 hypothetical protein [Streptomyces adustus]